MKLQKMAKWTKQSFDENDMKEKILLPYTYLAPLRIYEFVATKLPDAFNYWLRIPKEKLDNIKRILTKINYVNCMLDDLEDESHYRRMRPTAHRVFGVGMTLNTVIHLQFSALQDIIKLTGLKGAEIYCKEYLDFTLGQGASIYWREHQTDVTIEDYNHMTSLQCGFYIFMIVQLIQLFSDNKTDYEYLAKMFGIYYQMRDDYVDFKKPQAVEEGTRNSELQKLSELSFCEDFAEGKITTTVIHAMKGRHKEIIKGLLKMRSRDTQVKETLLALLEEAGGMQKTSELLRELEADMFAEIKRLGGNPILEELLRDLQCWDDEA